MPFTYSLKSDNVYRRVDISIDLSGKNHDHDRFPFLKIQSSFVFFSTQSIQQNGTANFPMIFCC